MASLFESLPNELHDMVFYYLLPGDFASLCKTSRTIALLAEPQLYRAFPGKCRSAQKLRDFVLRLIARPDLAALVSTLDLVPEQDEDLREAEADLSRARRGEYDYNAGWRRRRGVAEPVRPIPGYLRHEKLDEREDHMIESRMEELGVFAKISDGSDDDMLANSWNHLYANLLLALSVNVNYLRLDTDWCSTWCGRMPLNPKTLQNPIIDWTKISKLKDRALAAVERIDIVGRPSMITRRFWVGTTSSFLDETIEDWLERNGENARELRDVHEFIESRGFRERRTYGDQVPAMPLVCFPSLRTLRFEGVEIVSPGHVESESYISNITSLQFVDCAVTNEHAPYLKVILGAKNLRELELRLKTTKGHSSGYQFAGRVYTVLAENPQKHPLDKLVLTIEPCLLESDAPWWSERHWSCSRQSANFPCHHLQGLKQLELDYASMMDDDDLDAGEPWHTRLSECLPSSLEHLVIWEYPCDGEDDAREDGSYHPSERQDLEPLCAPDMLEDLAWDLPMMCPGLKTVEVHVSRHSVGPVMWPWSEEVETVEDLVALFRASGCKLTVNPPGAR
jgi:hypothetical protein